MRLVVTRRVEDQLADQLSVLAQHADPKTVDEHQDPRPDEAATEPDVMQPGVVTKRGLHQTQGGSVIENGNASP